MDPEGDHTTEFSKLLQHVSEEIRSILDHGFGVVSVESKIGRGKRRDVVVKRQRSDKFTIDESAISDS